MAPSIHAVIVTHNSQKVLPLCLAHLEQQSPALQNIVVVDSGSTTTEYLDSLDCSVSVQVIKTDNCGFGAANNLGYCHVSAKEQDIVIFLNPDTFLSNGFIAQMLQSFDENPHAAIVSGKLRHYDLREMSGSNRLDSTGIFRNWYGRWFDRGGGEQDHGQYDLIEETPALCGALLCCREKHLRGFDGKIFDEDFFLYKEDIELCLRLREKGKKLLYDPRLIAHHCRGWHGERRRMAYQLRLIAAESEIKLYRKHPSPYIIWATGKYILVKLFRL